MTIAAGYRDGKGTIGLICDSAVTTSFSFRSDNAKMFESGGLVWAIAGIMPPVFRQKRYPGTVAGVHSLARDLYEACLKKNHGAVTEEGVFTIPVYAIVIGKGIGPFMIDATGSVLEPTEGYIAVGSGSDVAMGAMHMAKSLDADTETALGAAFGAAVDLDPFCGGPGCLRLLSPVEARKTRKRTAT